MQPANNFIVLNIREYLASEDKRLGEDKLVQLLSATLSYWMNTKLYGRKNEKNRITLYGEQPGGT